MGREEILGEGDCSEWCCSGRRGDYRAVYGSEDRISDFLNKAEMIISVFGVRKGVQVCLEDRIDGGGSSRILLCDNLNLIDLMEYFLQSLLNTMTAICCSNTKVTRHGRNPS